LAERDGRRSRAASAGFHGVTATAIAFPLIGETATRLHILSPPAAALVIVVFVAIGLVVAWRHGLQTLSWITGLLALATSLTVARMTGALLPFVGAVFVLAAAAELLAFDDRFRGLRWATALG